MNSINLNNIISKVLRLSSHSLNIITSGEITNLFANDAYKVELVLCFFNYLWVRLMNTFSKSIIKII